MAKKSKKSQPKEPEPGSLEALMTRCVTLCQENCWREAAQVGNQIIVLARESGNDALADGFEQGAMQKIEYSLKRQMVACLITNAREFLKKEFLLDVAE